MCIRDSNNTDINNTENNETESSSILSNLICLEKEKTIDEIEQRNTYREIDVYKRQPVFSVTEIFKHYLRKMQRSVRRWQRR